MIWKCDADERKDDQEEDPNQMDRPNQKGYRNEGENWEETQENRKWENRDSWRFLWK